MSPMSPIKYYSILMWNLKISAFSPVTIMVLSAMQTDLGALEKLK